MTGHRSAGKIETKDRRGREGGIAIFSELKIADFPGLCVASLISKKFNLNESLETLLVDHFWNPGWKVKKLQSFFVENGRM